MQKSILGRNIVGHRSQATDHPGEHSPGLQVCTSVSFLVSSNDPTPEIAGQWGDCGMLSLGLGDCGMQGPGPRDCGMLSSGPRDCGILSLSCSKLLNSPDPGASPSHQACSFSAQVTFQLTGLAAKRGALECGKKAQAGRALPSAPTGLGLGFQREDPISHQDSRM